MSELAFFIDYSRCIGCQACVQACEECDTHRGRSLIHLETIERRDSVQTAPQVCMHCEDPICAQVCPADAIKQTPDGVVQSSLKPRCIGCSNCVLACPFGVPKYDGDADQMMKCDMCYDRTSTGRRPMCATVCPSGALAFTTIEEIMRTRQGRAVNDWQFGDQHVRTKVFVLVPTEVTHVDVGADPAQLAQARLAAAGRSVRCRGAAGGPVMADDRPRWREDFPVRWDEDHYMTRRELAKFLTLGSGLLASVNVLIAFIGLNARDPDHRRSSGSPAADDIAPGGSLLFRYPDRRTTPAFWCATSSGRLDAYSQVCTHLSCAVVHRPDERALACPCHKGSFSAARRATARRTADAAPAAHRDRAARRRDLVATGIEV